MFGYTMKIMITDAMRHSFLSFFFQVFPQIKNRLRTFSSRLRGFNATIQNNHSTKKMSIFKINCANYGVNQKVIQQETSGRWKGKKKKINK